MPAAIVAVVAAVAGGAAGYFGAVALGLTVTLASGAVALSGAGVLVAGAIGAVVSTAVGYGLSAALGLNKAPSTARPAADRKQMVRGSIEPRRVVYGRALVSGPLVYASSSGTDKELLHLVVPIAGHPIEAIDAIRINDTRVAASDLDVDGNVISGPLAKSYGTTFWGGPGTTIQAVRIRRYLGTQTAADPDLVAASVDGWGGACVGHGVAYLYIRLRYDRDLFPNGLQNIAAEVRGKRLFDPRTATTAYSANAALAVLDYLSMADGLACSADELDAASFIASANLSDELVPLAGGGTQRRYEVNGSFSLDGNPFDILDELLTASAGTVPYIQGRYRMHAGGYTAPTDTLGVSDIAGAIELVTRPSARELFNAARGTFIDPERSWQASEFPAVRDAAAEAEDGEVVWRDVPLPYEIDGTRAQRLAKLMLRRTREGATIRVPVRYAALRWCVWQSLAVTLPDFGFTAKPFRIVAWSFAPDRPGEVIVLTLREESAASYAWASGEGAAIAAAPDTSLVDPLVVPAPTGLALAPSTALQTDGTTAAALAVTWSQAGHPFIQAHEVQWRVKTPVGPWNAGEVQAGVHRFTIAPVLVGQVLEVRVRAIAGVARSPFTGLVEAAGAPDTTAPGVPSGLTATGQARAVALRWTNPADADLRHIEVWERLSTGGSVKVGESLSDAFVRAGLAPAEQRWFRLRAVDLSGNASAFTAEVSGTASLVATADIGGTAVTAFSTSTATLSAGGTSRPTSAAYNFASLVSHTVTAGGDGRVLVIARATGVSFDGAFGGDPGGSGEGTGG